MISELSSSPAVGESRGRFVFRSIALGGVAGLLEAVLALVTGVLPAGEAGLNFALLAAIFGGAAWVWSLVPGWPGRGRWRADAFLVLLSILPFALRGCPLGCDGLETWRVARSLGIPLLALLALGLAQAARPAHRAFDTTFISCLAMAGAAFDLARRENHPVALASLNATTLGLVAVALLGSSLLAKRRWAPNLLFTVLLGLGTFLWAGSQITPLRIEPSERRTLPPTKSQGGARPNVILIVMDTVRADHLSLYGYKRRTSPNLEALAAESLVFDHAVSSGNYSLTSHASLFTGLLPSQHGARVRTRRPEHAVFDSNETGLAQDVETLAARLGRLGFRRGGLSANHAYLAPWTGLQRGFEVFRDPPVRRLSYLPLSYSILGAVSEPDPGMLVLGVRGNKQFPKAWDAEHITEAGSHFATTAREPFLLFMNFFDAHIPYTPRPGRPFREPDQSPMARVIADYDAEIAYQDSTIGELVNGLRRESLLDRTVLVITADHGTFFGEHGLRMHRRGAYEEVLHVPLLVRYPKALRPGRIRRPFGLHEAHRLILDLVESRPTAWVNAESEQPQVLAQIWGRLTQTDTRRGPGRLEPDASVVYMPPFKLINMGYGRNELYDLSKDPHEQDNLLIQPVLYRAVRQRMQAAIKSLPAARAGDDSSASEADIDALRALGYIGATKPGR